MASGTHYVRASPIPEAKTAALTSKTGLKAEKGWPGVLRDAGKGLRINAPPRHWTQ